MGRGSDWDSGKDGYVQHYFDSRGVARLYEMSFGDGEWKLSRAEADFSPLDFAQWEHDFELSYIRTS